MKNFLTLGAFVLFSTALFSQQWNGNNTINTNHISRDGSVSIGLSDNYDQLNLSRNLRMVNGKITFACFQPNRGSYVNSYFDIKHISLPFSIMNVD